MTRKYWGALQEDTAVALTRQDSWKMLFGAEAEVCGNKVGGRREDENQ